MMSVPLLLVAFVLVGLTGFLYYRAHTTTALATLQPTTVMCAVLVVVLVVGISASCYSPDYTDGVANEAFTTSHRANLMPECEWMAYINKHVSPEECSIRDATTQPTPATTKLLVQHADSGEVMLPTQMQTSPLAYVLRVWVTATNRNALQRTNPFHICYSTTRTKHTQDIATQYRIVEEQHVPYDALVGTRWFLVESSAFRVPPSATSVHWLLNATSHETHWSTFEVQHKRNTPDFEPTDGLRALYSTFLEGSNIHNRRWHDESGHDGVTLFDETPKKEDKGVVVPSVWTGPSSSLLVSNDSDNGHCTDNKNIVNFTMSFYYKAPAAPPASATAPPPPQPTEPFTLFTIYGKYRNQQQRDNPPNYFLRCEVDASKEHLCFVQQHVPDGAKCMYAEKKFVVPLPNHSDEPVLYTVVVQSNTRTSGDIDVFTNGKHEKRVTKWLDLNYNLQRDDHVVWGDRPAHTGHTHHEHAHSSGSHGILYMLALFNTALARHQVRLLSRCVLRKYNSPPVIKAKTYEYYVPVQQLNTEDALYGQQNGGVGDTGNADDADEAGNIPSQQVACVKYKPSATDGISDMTCSYVASGEEEKCAKGKSTDDDFYYYPVPNQNCDEAMNMLNAVQEDAKDLGMQWQHEPVDGFSYRSQLTDDAYNKLTPQQKMNVLNDRTYLRTYRKW